MRMMLFFTGLVPWVLLLIRAYTDHPVDSMSILLAVGAVHNCLAAYLYKP